MLETAAGVVLPCGGKLRTETKTMTTSREFWVVRDKEPDVPVALYSMADPSIDLVEFEQAPWLVTLWLVVLWLVLL